uniref:F-box domain-containing protein n=1 Tax=Mycena chlorophos TaxID=658473 RepID=A0ABQ0M792_MYCCL|nr:predicted protein [Mycena chlorophos]
MELLDKEDLLACALVCQALLGRCRRHLFQNKLEVIELVPRNISRFAQVIRSPHCTLGPYIRSIYARRYYWASEDSVFTFIAPLLRRLPAVRSLRFRLQVLVNGTTVDDHFRQGFVTGFPHVTRLHLHCTFEQVRPIYPAPLQDLIACFPACVDLEIEPLSNARIASSSNARPPSELHSVSLCQDAAKPILTWLDAAGHLGKITTLALPLLRVDVDDDDDVISIREALEKMGHTLRRLVVPFSQEFDSQFDPEMLRALDLSRFSNLQALIINDVSEFYDLEDDQGQTARLVGFVTKLQASTLEEISISLPASSYSGLESWALFDAHFASHRFPSLRRMTLEDPRQDKGFFRTALPKLFASGVLCVLDAVPVQFVAEDSK